MVYYLQDLKTELYWSPCTKNLIKNPVAVVGITALIDALQSYREANLVGYLVITTNYC